jgi:hypothetical protein
VFSTMQDEPLSLATLLRYASTFQSDATVSTWTGEEIRSVTFGEVGEQAARLANALRGLGVGAGDRVATRPLRQSLVFRRSRLMLKPTRGVNPYNPPEASIGPGNRPRLPRHLHRRASLGSAN